MRTFNAIAAERHIAHCKDARHRPRPPPSKAEVERKAHQRRASLLRNTTGEGRVVYHAREEEAEAVTPPSS